MEKSQSFPKSRGRISQYSIGCFGILFPIVGGMFLWALLYRIVMLHYGIRFPGGHHFGGNDLATLEAIAAGIFMGPFVGLAILVLLVSKLGSARFLIAGLLVIIPIKNAHKDFSGYRKGHTQIG